ncbi:hypothetical protein [Natronocalculus amylovorans]|uniref:Uncharacterized protein n=1 Tax=Natronocalculus amylovorans TaxID=2917812 RepID=A0AAE3K707_9EURY|nr:hypothetical protein [Natronocalculus amylovorans]MCL9815563.1 hypothetical protein [Natronocalculus amylovorans]NUE01923.1 hypothetical protein [Halorubraceae archaeon YAN]
MPGSIVESLYTMDTRAMSGISTVLMLLIALSLAVVVGLFVITTEGPIGSTGFVMPF